MRPEFEAAQAEWLQDTARNAIIDTIVSQSPSQWAEANRYLPPNLTPMPGPFRFEVTPYLREPLDCLNPDNPTRELTIMKGAQVCVTAIWPLQ